MLNTKDGQAAAEDFRTKFSEPEEKKLQAKQQEMTELNDKLQRGANTMSQTAQDDMKKTLDRKNTEYKRAVEDYQFDRDEMQRKLLDDLSGKMQAVIARFAQENACALFLDVTNPNSGIMWIADQVDVTRQIVDAYDKAQPTGTARRRLRRPASNNLGRRRLSRPRRRQLGRLRRLRPSRPLSNGSRGQPAPLTSLLRSSLPEST